MTIIYRILIILTYFEHIFTKPPSRLLYKDYTNARSKLAFRGIGKNQDYLSFVRNNQIWVDKSLLIAHIVDTSKTVIVLTAPRRWGKSLNLEMIKFFFGIPTSNGDLLPATLDQNAAHEYFNLATVLHENGTREKLRDQPLIFNHKPSLYHLGKYPIIHLNFHDADNLSCIHSIIRNAFNQHQYLKHMWQEVIDKKEVPEEERSSAFKHYEYFLNFSECHPLLTPTPFQLAASLEFLVEALFGYHHVGAILLVDEYDYQFENYYYGVKTIDEEQEKEILHFYDCFYELTMFYTEHLWKAIFTGVLRVENKVELFQPINTMENNNYRPFYGFTSEETDELMATQWLTPAQMKEMINFYSGYRSSNDDKPVYNPYSIAKCFRAKRVFPHWYYSGNELAYSFLKYDPYVQTILKLCAGGKTHEINYLKLYRLSLDDIHKLRIIYTSDDYGPTAFKDIHALDEILSLLYMAGFLTMVPVKPPPLTPPSTVRLQFPNLEIKHSVCWRAHLLKPDKWIVVPPNETQVQWIDFTETAFRSRKITPYHHDPIH